MFNVCRRGPASICRIAQRATVAFAPISRPSTFSLAARAVSKPSIVSRCLHVTTASRSSDLAALERQVGSPANGDPLITSFSELAQQGLVHPNIISQITDVMGHSTMTPVQTMTINETLKGTDVIAQARTGTGKTLGFLVPIIQRILVASPELATAPAYSQRAKASDIRGIIISPTRELAEQIAVEAKKLTKGTGIKTQVAVGGSHKKDMLRRMQYEGCHLLVATPGRLNDLLSDPFSRVAAPNLKALVLDEADRLLDSGFADAVEDIIGLLPDRATQDRQTLLFSATIPQEVMGLVRRTLKPDFQFVQTVDPNEPATHEKVPQAVVNVGGYENMMPTLLELCKREIEKAETDGTSFKAIVYFSSTANVELAARVFQGLKSSKGELFGKHPLYPADISHMHGKLTQEGRTRVSERFRRAKSAVMFSSDVTARGMDFPNVTHVIQCGMPPNKEQYIHRIGRTGRGDKSGEGWLMLPDLEMNDARMRLRGLPIQADKTLEAAKVDMTRDAQLPASLALTLSQVGDAIKMIDRPTKVAAYLAMLGTLQNLGNKQRIIDVMNQWTRFGWGWELPPMISHGVAAKLGLTRVSGVNIGHEPEPALSSRRSRGGRESGGYGGGRGGGGFGGGRGRESYGDGREGGGRDGGRDGGHGGSSWGESGRSTKGYSGGGGRGRRVDHSSGQPAERPW